MEGKFVEMESSAKNKAIPLAGSYRQNFDLGKHPKEGPIRSRLVYFMQKWY